MTGNSLLKNILFDAKLICTHKMNSITTFLKNKETSTNNGQVVEKELKELAKINAELLIILKYFDNPDVWLKPIEFDQVKFTEYVNKIDATDITKWQPFKQNMEAIIGFIKEHFQINFDREVEVDEINATMANLNLETIEVLRLSRHAIDGRISFFKGQGIDMVNHVVFQKTNSDRKKLWKEYKKLLSDNQINSTEQHLRMLNRVKLVIPGITEFPKLIQLNTSYINFIKPQIPQA